MRQASISGMKMTTRHLRKLKHTRPIVAVTAYDAVMATLADRAGVDLILVGDSVGNVLLGFENTIPVTVEMMLHHTAAVSRARPQAMVVGDLPFPEAHREFPVLLEVCRRYLQEAGAEAVKLEGGAEMAPKVKRLVEAGIPVLGHVGLMPQKVHAMGGYRRFGKAEAERADLLNDVRALEDAGAFAIIGEAIDGETTEVLTQALDIPFIGIGCGPRCDGQILVSNDLLGLGVSGYPSFSKQYENLAASAEAAFRAYAGEVREGHFPASRKASVASDKATTEAGNR